MYPIGSNQLQQQSNNLTAEYNHQTFQSWIDTLVDKNSNDDTKLKAIQDLSLNLEVNNYSCLNLEYFLF